MEKKLFSWAVFVLLVAFLGNALAGEPSGFTQQDRERLIRLEATLETFMKQVDRRFEQVDRRFEQVDGRFEQVDRRISELRQDMNKRFEQVDKRFEQAFTFMWILAGIFTTLTVAVIGFAFWDRRTIIRKARDEAIEAIEKEGRLSDLIRALRELAKEDSKLADVLRGFRLM